MEKLNVKCFTPRDQCHGFGNDFREEIDRMIDEFYRANPSYNEVSRKYDSITADVIACSYRNSVTLEIGVTVYQKG